MSEGAPPVDLDRLVRNLGGDLEIARELLSIYLNQSDERLVIARDHLASSDYLSLGEDAHGLKGASANIGADRLRELSASLEAAMKNREHGRADDVLREMESEYGRVRAFILGWV